MSNGTEAINIATSFETLNSETIPSWKWEKIKLLLDSRTKEETLTRVQAVRVINVIFVETGENDTYGGASLRFSDVPQSH
jgi:hypothetical protein